MTSRQHEDAGRSNGVVVAGTAEPRSAIVACDLDPFSSAREVVPAVDEAIRGLRGSDELVGVALTAISLPAFSGEAPGTTGVLITALVRPLP